MRASVLLITAMTIVAGSVMRPAGEQSAGKASGSPRLSHVGIVVRDIDAAIQLIASLTGADKSAIRPTVEQTPKGISRAAQVRLSNISFELLQPAADAPATFRTFVDANGVGVHHLGLQSTFSGSMKDQVNPRVQAGGTVVASETDRAFVDLSSRLGPMLEILSPALHDRLYPGAPAPRLKTASPFAQLTCVTHVGVVVRDIEQARQTYEELLGVAPSPTQPLEAAATGSARYTFFKLPNITIELLQQAAGVKGAYADFLGAHGQRVHHIGLHLRGKDAGYRTVPQQLAWLEQHGGRVGVNAGGFAYMDVGLGVFVEALSEESINRVYPCN
jgi:catechol 2,3-dioxygenase-like lactoylglutathione lyase family enzyme